MKPQGLLLLAAFLCYASAESTTGTLGNQNATEIPTTTTLSHADKVPSTRATIRASEGVVLTKSSGFSMRLLTNTMDVATELTSIAAGNTSTISSPSFDCSANGFSIGSSTASLAINDNGNTVAIASATTTSINAAAITLDANSVTLNPKETLAVTASQTASIQADSLAITAPTTTIKADNVELGSGSASFNLNKDSVNMAAPDVNLKASSGMTVEAGSIKMQTDASGSTMVGLDSSTMTIKSDNKVTLTSATRSMNVDTVIATVATMRQRVANLKSQLAAKKALLNSMMDTQESDLTSLETQYDGVEVAQGAAEDALSNRLSTSESDLSQSEQDLEATLSSNMGSVDINSQSLETAIQAANTEQGSVSSQESSDQSEVTAALGSLDTELGNTLTALASEQTALGKDVSSDVVSANSKVNSMRNSISSQASSAVNSFKPVESRVVSLDASVNRVDSDMSTLKSDVSSEVSGLESTLAKTNVAGHVSKANKLKGDTATLSAGLSKALPLAHIVNDMAKHGAQLSADVPLVKSYLQAIIPSDNQVAFPASSSATYQYFGGACDNAGHLYACGISRYDVVNVFSVNPTSGKVARTQTITDPSPYKSSSTYFGSAVAMDGTVMVAGAFRDRANRGRSSYTYGGAAYIYTRSSTSATTFTYRTRMLHPSPATYDYCGLAVAVSGLYMSMACYGDDTPRSTTGSVVVYRRLSATSTSFSRVNVAYPPSNLLYSSTTRLGYSFTSSVKGPMAISGSLIMAGAPYYRTSSRSYYVGAVFVFQVTSTSRVVYKQRVLNRLTRTYEYFGTAIATHGSFAFISAYRGRVGSSYNVGGVYVYKIGSASSSSPLTYHAQFGAPKPVAYTYFGNSLSVSDDGLVVSVGAYQENGRKGAVYFMKRDGSDWSKTPTVVKKYAPTTAAVNDYWGYGYAQYSSTYQIVSSVAKDSYKGSVLALTKRVLFP